MKKYQTLCKGMLWNIYHIIVYSGIVIKFYVFIFVLFRLYVSAGMISMVMVHIVFQTIHAQSTKETVIKR
jgi:hypothetical protein